MSPPTKTTLPHEPDGDSINLHPCVTATVQRRTLEALLDAVRSGAARGQRPVVEIDLDLCSLRPVFRTRSALQQIAQEFDLPEIADPASLSVLPGYSDEAWLEFIRLFGLEACHPGLEWTLGPGRPSRRPDTPFARFHELYWLTPGLGEDSPTPGLGSFAHRVERAGGQIVFLSGRWLPEQKAPSLTALRRAGIAHPRLVIGNPWHETLVANRSDSVSDAQIKAWHQQEIVRDFGPPVAIIDDRAGNRAAVQTAAPGEVLGIAIAIPGFTCDPANTTEPLRLSTFEFFDESLLNGPPRPHLKRRYPALGLGLPWNGLYEGLGRNARAYVLPRLHSTASRFDRPFLGIIETHAEGSLAEGDFLDRCADLVPSPILAQFRSAMDEARDLASRGLADTFPATAEGEAELHRILVAAWLHSRDIETLMEALGYKIQATGVHDLVELVDAREVIRLLVPAQQPAKSIAASKKYSPWLIRWASTLDPDTQVNVGLLNPAILVSFSRWSPSQTSPQDAMDVHRLSDHHEGDLAERYDPVESAVNNLLHQREGLHGVRKEPIANWIAIRASLERESGAENLTKTSVGREIVRDAARIAPDWERAGALTPWGLVTGASFE